MRVALDQLEPGLEVFGDPRGELGRRATDGYAAVAGLETAAEGRVAAAAGCAEEEDGLWAFLGHSDDDSDGDEG